MHLNWRWYYEYSCGIVFNICQSRGCPRSGTRCCGGTDEIRSIVGLGQRAQDLRTPDYYLTTVSEDTKKPGSHCGAMASRFAPFFLNICAKLLEPLGHQRSNVDGLITPTFQALPVETSGNPLQSLAFSQCRGKISRLLTTI